jgi:hypothetical protein
VNIFPSTDRETQDNNQQIHGYFLVIFPLILIFSRFRWLVLPKGFLWEKSWFMAMKHLINGHNGSGIDTVGSFLKLVLGASIIFLVVETLYDLWLKKYPFNIMMMITMGWGFIGFIISALSDTYSMVAVGLLSGLMAGLWGCFFLGKNIIVNKISPQYQWYCHGALTVLTIGIMVDALKITFINGLNL